MLALDELKNCYYEMFHNYHYVKLSTILYYT
jgi:hypothetical protein